MKQMLSEYSDVSCFAKEAMLLCSISYKNAVSFHWAYCPEPCAIMLENIFFDFKPFGVDKRVNEFARFAKLPQLMRVMRVIISAAIRTEESPLDRFTKSNLLTICLLSKLTPLLIQRKMFFEICPELQAVTKMIENSRFVAVYKLFARKRPDKNN